MKNPVLAACAAGMALFTAFVGPVWAQDKGVQIAQPLGVVTEDTQVTLDSNKIGLTAMKKFKAGETCTLPAGTVVVLLGTSADGKQRVQRSSLLAKKMPSTTACPVGATATVEPAKASAWKQAADAKAAEKAKSGKKG